jgi:hypothetical protein
VQVREFPGRQFSQGSLAVTRRMLMVPVPPSFCSVKGGGQDRSPRGEFRSVTLWRFGNPNLLGDHLALLIGGEKRDIGGVAAASDAYNALDWSQPGWVDQPPAVR